MSEQDSQPLFSHLEHRKVAGVRMHELVEQHILEKITSGEIRTGAKLPPTAEIATQMGLNLNLVQKALARLSARGYLVRKPNFGTVVTYREAEPTNVFLLIGPCLREEPNHFDRRLSKLVEAELFSRGYNPLVYDNLDEVFKGTAAGARLASQMFADLVHFAPKAFVEEDVLSLRLPELAGLQTCPSASFRPLAEKGDVYFDLPAFYTAAVEAAAERGRSRVVLILKNRGPHDPAALQAFWSAAKARNIEVLKVLHVDGERCSSLEKPLTNILTRELREWKRLPASKQPNALVMMDDILLRAASLCLLHEGMASSGILPISLVNEGIEIFHGLPAVGIETPMTKTASLLVDILDARMGRGGTLGRVPYALAGRVVEMAGQNLGMPDSFEAESASANEKE